MRHPLVRTRPVRVHVTAPPRVDRIGTATPELLLTVAGREVALRLHDGSIVFARVVGPSQIRRWGCRDLERVDLATVATAIVVEACSWRSATAIGRAQRRGWRIEAETAAHVLVDVPIGESLPADPRDEEASE